MIINTFDIMLSYRVLGWLYFTLESKEVQKITLLEIK